MIKIFESKAIVVALLTVIAGVAGYEGLNIPVTTILTLMTPLMIAIGAAGWSDVTQIKAKLALDHDMKMHALVHGNTVEGLTTRDAEGRVVRTPQSGFVKLGTMVGAAAIALSLILGSSVVVTSDGCGSTPPVVTNVVTDVVDCVKAEGIVITNGFTLTQVINTVYGAIASIATGGVPAALAILSGVAAQFGPDLVACIVDDYPTNVGSGSGSGSSAAKLTLLPPLDPAIKAQLLQQYAPNKTFNHGKTK